MGEQSIAGLAADALRIASKVADTQKAIVLQQARSKRNIRLIAVSVVLDLALSVFFVFLAVDAAHVSAQIHRSQLQACAIGNSFRAGQVRLWDHVIAVSVPPPHETPAAKDARLDTLTAFRAYIRHQFQPVNCHRLYP